MNHDFTINYFAQLADFDGFRPVFRINLIDSRTLIKGSISN